MKTIDKYLLLIQDVADMSGSGMMSRNPPAETQEVEVNDTESDKQQKQILKWSKTKNLPRSKELPWSKI